MGIWNRPAEARGPKVMRAMRQPHRTMICGETREDAEGTDVADIGAALGIMREAELSSGYASAVLKVYRVRYDGL
jgi:hypothetical protein